MVQTVLLFLNTCLVWAKNFYIVSLPSFLFFGTSYFYDDWSKVIVLLYTLRLTKLVFLSFLLVSEDSIPTELILYNMSYDFSASNRKTGFNLGVTMVGKCAKSPAIVAGSQKCCGIFVGYPATSHFRGFKKKFT